MADCPYCLQPGASRFLWFVKCANAGCPKYDEKLQVTRAKEMSRPKKGRVVLSTLEGPQAIAGSVGQGPTVGSLFRGFRYLVGYGLIAAAIILYIGEKTDVLKTGFGGKNLFWMGLLGYWILPSKKRKPLVEREAEPEPEFELAEADELKERPQIDRRM
jgi:hypothetical protein